MSDKVSPVQIRADEKYKEFLRNNAAIRGMSVTELIKTAVLYYVNDTKNDVKEQIKKEEYLKLEHVEYTESSPDEIKSTLSNIKSNKYKYLQITKNSSSDLYELKKYSLNNNIFTAKIKNDKSINISIDTIYCVYDTRMILNIFIR